MVYKTSSFTAARLAVAMVAILTALISFGCVSTPEDTNSPANTSKEAAANTTPADGANTGAVSNSDAGSNSETGSTANSNASPASQPAPPAKQPDRYSLTMTISGQSTGEGKQTQSASQQIDFAVRGADRRWAMQVPGIGPFVYLEKSGLKYVIFPARNQYVEVTPQQLGIRPDELLTPSAIVERMKERAQLERIGAEKINGREAIKYRYVAAKDASAQSDEGESFVYVDVNTGLPLRADINFRAPNGATARGVMETLDLSLAPAAELFEVPEGMNKVTPEQAKQQLQRATAFVRLITGVMNRRSQTSEK
ncbi:MAG: hypothetical protein L0229_27485 [Blastocatellia bacterium]|nr:hypothetical protein [Blastocatellia bacterium]